MANNKREKTMILRAIAAALAIAGCGGSNASEESGLQQLPAPADLCKIQVGKPLDARGFRTYGTHADDIRGVLGEPTEQTGMRWVYEWCADAHCEKVVKLTLQLEQKQLCYRTSGAVVTPGLWLKDVMVEGTPALDCWRPAVTATAAECSECLDTSELKECA